MLKNWTKADIIFYSVSITLIIVTGIIFKAYWISFLVSIIGITAGILNMKANKYSYVLYTLQAILYAYVSWHNKFIGEALLAGLYLFPVYLYSAIKWIRVSRNEPGLQIFRITKKLLIILAVAGILVTAGYGYVLNLLNSNLPYINALGTFTSVAAGYLSARRIKEQWYFWIAYSLIFSGIWLSTLGSDTSQMTLILQNIPFLYINIVGLVQWNKMYKESNENSLRTNIPS
ncbi:MAG: nicotinamide riboside transporter PnuC [Clostridia bacterium]|jgi:nicotinamide mononucleotide transporter PnuC